MIRNKMKWMLLVYVLAFSSCSYLERAKRLVMGRPSGHQAVIVNEDGTTESERIRDIDEPPLNENEDGWGDWDDEETEAPDDVEDLLEGLEIPATVGAGEQLLIRTGYTTSYNYRTKCPNWVAWVLTRNHVDGPHKRKGIRYTEDDEVPFPKAMNSDYSGSGYDRGHMCPSGDNKWDAQAQLDCFLFTNMCPQSHNLNGGDWNDLEIKCRKWAEKYGKIYIVCGPVFNSSSHNKHRKAIGHNKVAVPDGFFKVVLCMEGKPKAIGFYYENDDGHAPMPSYAQTVDTIEEMTGMDFFPALPDDVEDRIEAEADFKLWQ